MFTFFQIVSRTVKVESFLVLYLKLNNSVRVLYGLKLGDPEGYDRSLEWPVTEPQWNARQSTKYRKRAENGKELHKTAY